MDLSTGLQNNLNRWYDAQLGRWLSQEPLGFPAGDANLYRYAGNRPTGVADSTGLQAPAYPGLQVPHKPIRPPKPVMPPPKHESSSIGAFERPKNRIELLAWASKQVDAIAEAMEKDSKKWRFNKELIQRQLSEAVLWCFSQGFDRDFSVRIISKSQLGKRACLVFGLVPDPIENHVRVLYKAQIDAVKKMLQSADRREIQDFDQAIIEACKAFVEGRATQQQRTELFRQMHGELNVPATRGIEARIPRRPPELRARRGFP